MGRVNRRLTGKLNGEAAELFGRAYGATPKSVFAVVAWHLANVASGRIDAAGSAVERFFQEWQILHEQGIVPQRPTRAKAAVVPK